jgi:hypothetical protein
MRKSRKNSKYPSKALGGFRRGFFNPKGKDKARGKKAAPAASCGLGF